MQSSDTVDLVAALHGRFFVLRQDMVVSRSMALYGEWTESEFNLAKGILHAGAIAIDVGANLGCMTVPLAHAVGPAGTVWAFEPQPGIFRLLAANTLLNGALNTRLFAAACGAENGVLELAELDYSHPDNYGALSLSTLQAAAPRSALRRKVPVVVLDEVFDGPSLRLIKIDVEGMEADVVRGAASIIRRHRPFLYVENEMPGEGSVATIDLVTQLGYRLYWHCAPQFNPRNFRGNPHNVFGHNVCVNMFCVPNEVELTLTGVQRVASPQEHPRLPS